MPKPKLSPEEKALQKKKAATRLAAPAERPKHLTDKEWEKAKIYRQELEDIAHCSNLDIIIPEDFYLPGLGHHTFLTICRVCGAEKKRSKSAIKNKPYCPACKLKHANEKRRIERLKFYQEIIDKCLEVHKGCQFPERDKIKGLPQEKTFVICENGHEFHTRILDLQITSKKLSVTSNYNKWCKRCFHEKGRVNDVIKDIRENSSDYDFLEANPDYNPGTDEFYLKQLKEYADAVGCNVLSTKWEGYEKEYIFQCQYCRHVFKKNPHMLIIGRKTGDPTRSNNYLIRNGWCCLECYRNHLRMYAGRLEKTTDKYKEMKFPYGVNLISDKFLL